MNFEFQRRPVVNVTQRSTPIIGILGVSFVVLKLIGIINWSWWWVTVPFWGGFALIFGAILLMAFIFGILTAIENKH